MPSLERVMFVDDDPDIRTVLDLSLTIIGKYHVMACESGLEALERVGDFLPQLVLLDVMMPIMDGTETIKKLRALPCMKDVPVVFLTAKATRDELEALLEHGATGVIVKPFDPVSLPKDILMYWTHASG